MRYFWWQEHELYLKPADGERLIVIGWQNDDDDALSRHRWPRRPGEPFTRSGHENARLRVSAQTSLARDEQPRQPDAEAKQQEREDLQQWCWLQVLLLHLQVQEAYK